MSRIVGSTQSSLQDGGSGGDVGKSCRPGIRDDRNVPPCVLADADQVEVALEVVHEDRRHGVGHGRATGRGRRGEALGCDGAREGVCHRDGATAEIVERRDPVGVEAGLNETLRILRESGRGDDETGEEDEAEV